MPKRVINVFKVIQIEKHQSDLLAVTARQGNCLHKPVIQQKTISQISKNIVMGQM